MNDCKKSIFWKKFKFILKAGKITPLTGAVTFRWFLEPQLVIHKLIVEYTADTSLHGSFEVFHFLILQRDGTNVKFWYIARHFINSSGLRDISRYRKLNFSSVSDILKFGVAVQNFDFAGSVPIWLEWKGFNCFPCVFGAKWECFRHGYPAQWKYISRAPRYSWYWIFFGAALSRRSLATGNILF